MNIKPTFGGKLKDKAMDGKSFKEGDRVIVKYDNKTPKIGVVIKYDKNEKQGSAIYPGGIVYLKDPTGRYTGTYLFPAVDVILKVRL